MSTPNPTTLINPTTFAITDPTLAADNVTGFRVLFSRTKGGPYTLSSVVPATDINAAAGTATGKLTDLNTQLAPGDWFAVSEAVNVSGDSPNSPEFAFTIVPPLPQAPTIFTLA